MEVPVHCEDVSFLIGAENLNNDSSESSTSNTVDKNKYFMSICQIISLIPIMLYFERFIKII